MAIKTVSMRELETLLESGKKIKIKTDTGFHPVVKFYNNGTDEVFRINGLLDVTKTHEVFIESKGKIPVSQVELGDRWITEDGSMEVFSIESQGTRQVGDLQVDHPDHRYYANGFLVSNCGHCLDEKTTKVRIKIDDPLNTVVPQLKYNNVVEA